MSIHNLAHEHWQQRDAQPQAPVLSGEGREVLCVAVSLMLLSTVRTCTDMLPCMLPHTNHPPGHHGPRSPSGAVCCSILGAPWYLSGPHDIASTLSRHAVASELHQPQPALGEV